MDTSKIVQQCLHHHILTTGSSEMKGGYSGGQGQLSNHIHVWYAYYSVLDQNYLLMSPLISPEEKQKAAGFKKPDDTRRYILRHGMVRVILGEYIHEDPEKIQFIKTKSGKPDLDPEGKFPDVRFSLSHTDEMVCLGITRNYEIGMDIVKTNPRTPFSEIEQYLFTTGERRWIERTILEQRSLQFFRIWSLKEALLKATGSDVTMMKEADVSGIITDTFLDGFYTIHLGNTDIRFFIHECGCNHGHHCAIAVNLGT
jgi:4'-phosphopantetheinyl transferase